MNIETLDFVIGTIIGTCICALIAINANRVASIYAKPQDGE